MDNKSKTHLFHKLRRVYEFCSMLTVEPYMFAFMFVYTLKRVPTDQMVQDKICRLSFKLDATYCQQLPTTLDDDDYLGKKSEILAQGTIFTIYQVILLTVPSLVASLFIGSWCDKYIKAKKVLLMAGAVAAVLESIVLILNDYFFDITQYTILVALVPGLFTGGILALLMSLWAYIAATTPPQMRAIRMTIVEIIIGFAQPLGTYIGGLVLNTKSMYSSGQLHNYSGVYIIAGLTYILALLWTVFMINEERDIKKWDHRFNVVAADEVVVTPGSDQKAEGSAGVSKMNARLQRYEQHRHVSPARLLFNIENMREMWRTCAKARPNHVRLQIWLLLLSMTCYLLSHVGPMIFMFQFAQKVYSWDSKTYSNSMAIGSVVTAAATVCIAPILFRVFKLKDTTLSMVGLASYLGQNVIRGLVLTPDGFFYALIPGCLGSVASIGIRSHFSKIIAPDELGKVFSCLAALESFTPLLAAGLFTIVFNNTMDSMAGLSLLLVASILIIPIAVLIWIHNCTVLPDNKGNNYNNNCDDGNIKPTNHNGVNKLSV